MAFDRGGAIAVGTRLPMGLKNRGGWGDSVIVLPGHPLVDVISNRVFQGGPQPLAEVLESYPVALLAPLPRPESASAAE